MNEGVIQNGRRPPPSICTICFEKLLRYERDEENPHEFVMSPIIALKCGHLLHTKCTIKFFQSQGAAECDELKDCPFCARKNRWCDMRRILLTQSPNDDDITTSVNKNNEPLIDFSTSPACPPEECPQPTPSLCTICHDYLLDYEDDQTGLDLRPIVALKCGHLLHTECNNKWFLSQENQDGELKECAYCRRKNRWCDTIRILLTLDYRVRN